MKILAFEFSSSQRSVAVLVTAEDGGVLASSEVVESSPRNTMKPLGMTEAALREVGIEREEIECIAVGLGPGSYTGIRAAIALAQGWSLAREIRTLGVSSAECIAVRAQSAGLRGKVAVAIDAQRQEFYLAGYHLDETSARETTPLRLARSEEITACERAGDLLIGPEVTRWFPNGRPVFPDAASVARLAAGRNDFISADRIEPIYLRETTFVKAPPPRQLPS